MSYFQLLDYDYLVCTCSLCEHSSNKKRCAVVRCIWNIKIKVVHISFELFLNLFMYSMTFLELQKSLKDLCEHFL